jgi:hypothetical protein
LASADRADPDKEIRSCYGPKPQSGEGKDACDEEELVEVGLDVVVVGVAAAGLEATGDAGLPEVRGVVARVTLGETDA